MTQLEQTVSILEGNKERHHPRPVGLPFSESGRRRSPGASRGLDPTFRTDILAEMNFSFLGAFEIYCRRTKNTLVYTLCIFLEFTTIY